MIESSAASALAAELEEAQTRAATLEQVVRVESERRAELERELASIRAELESARTKFEAVGQPPAITGAAEPPPLEKAGAPLRRLPPGGVLGIILLVIGLTVAVLILTGDLKLGFAS